MKRNIQDFDIFYKFLRPIIAYATFCHYATMVVKGRNNLPKSGHYILAPCHQSALMDPLNVLCVTTRDIVFLARADIFENPVAHFFLTFLKILPVYRIRDGKQNLSRNEAIFSTSEDVLVSGTPLCLMAEGTHNHQHRMLPLVKGMFRIAGSAQHRLDPTPLYIVPVGLDYDEYERPYSNVVVNIGQPIDVRQFLPQFVDDEPTALNQMRDALTQALHKQMLDIRDRDHYDEIIAACDIANTSMRKAKGLANTTWNRYTTRMLIADLLPDGCPEALDYDALCHQLRVRRKVAADAWSWPLLLGATLLVAAFFVGLFMNGTFAHIVLFLFLCYPIAYLPTYFIPRRLIADPQFRSSINFAIHFGLTILYIPIFSIIYGCVHGFCAGILAFVVALLMQRLGGPIVNFVKAFVEHWHFRFVALSHAHEVKRLKELQTIISRKIMNR